MFSIKNHNFYPLFLMSSVDRFNDSFIKQIVILTVTYGATMGSGGEAEYLSIISVVLTVSSLLLALPLADISNKFNRRHLTLIYAGYEVFCVSVFIISLLFKVTEGYLIAMFLLGFKFAFFNSVRPLLLRQNTPEHQWIQRNGQLDGVGQLLALIGFSAAGYAISNSMTPILISVIVIAFTVIKFYGALMLPDSPAPTPDIIIQKNILKQTYVSCKNTLEDWKISRVIFGLCYNSAVVAIYFTYLPSYCKTTLGLPVPITQSIILVGNLGFIVGPLIASRLLGGIVQATYLPISAIFMAIVGLDLYFYSIFYIPDSTATDSFLFLKDPNNLRVYIDVFMISFLNGIFSVSLLSYLQKLSSNASYAINTGVTTVFKSLLIIGSSFIIGKLISKKYLRIEDFFLILFFANLFFGIYLAKLLPADLFRSLARGVLQSLFRVKVVGLNNVEQAGDKALIISNYVSLLDEILISAYIPRDLTFYIERSHHPKWYLKPFMYLINKSTSDISRPLGLREFVNQINLGKIGMMFPEGRISSTGSVMKVSGNALYVAHKTKSNIIPIRINGPQFSFFSMLQGKLKQRMFPEITISIGSPIPPPVSLPSRESRLGILSEQTHVIMTEMMYMGNDFEKPLPQSLYNNLLKYPSSKIAIVGDTRHPLFYRDLYVDSVKIALNFKYSLPADETHFGIITSLESTSVLNILGVFFLGKTSIILNPQLSSDEIIKTLEAQGIRTILATRTAIKTESLEILESALIKRGFKLVYQEDLPNKSSFMDALGKFLINLFPRIGLSRVPNSLEGKIGFMVRTGEGISIPTYTSKNIQAVRFQVNSWLDLLDKDAIFNTYPLYSEFGLLAGTLFPILSGTTLQLHENSEDFVQTANTIYRCRSSIVLAPGSILGEMGRYAHPYDFISVRYIFSDASRLTPDTYKLFHEKFGIRIMGGIGLPGICPLFSGSSPLHYNRTSLGKVLPGFKIHSSEGETILEGETISKHDLSKGTPVSPTFLPKKLFLDHNKYVYLTPKG